MPPASHCQWRVISDRGCALPRTRILLPTCLRNNLPVFLFLFIYLLFISFVLFFFSVFSFFFSLLPFHSFLLSRYFFLFYLFISFKQPSCLLPCPFSKFDISSISSWTHSLPSLLFSFDSCYGYAFTRRFDDL